MEEKTRREIAELGEEAHLRAEKRAEKARNSEMATNTVVEMLREAGLELGASVISKDAKDLVRGVVVTAERDPATGGVLVTFDDVVRGTSYTRPAPGLTRE